MHRTIEMTAGVPLDDATVLELLARAQALYEAVPVSKIELTQGLDLVTFDYKITAVDTRVWSQQIVFAAWPNTDNDPPMTFDVPEGWRRIAEFQHHRALRDLLITMINTAGLISLEIIWHS